MATHRDAAAAHEAAATHYEKSGSVDDEAKRLTGQAVDTTILVWCAGSGAATEADSWAATCLEALAEGADSVLMGRTHTLAALAHRNLALAN
jgi:hypothetical protein